MKNWAIGIIVCLLAWAAYKEPAVRQMVEQGPGEALAEVRNWAGNYQPEVVRSQLLDALRPNAEAQEYLQQISAERANLEEFHFRHCQRLAIEHEVLSSIQLEQACAISGKHLGQK